MRFQCCKFWVYIRAFYDIGNVRFVNQFVFFNLCLKYITRKFITIRSNEIFPFDVCYFSFIIYFFTYSLISGILFPTSPIFVLGRAVVANLLVSDSLLSMYVLKTIVAKQEFYSQHL